jgi:tetratricopeptide (TPR) repeat protein
MGDPTRIEDLRRRVQQDPASIAFAQLAEELRRAGAFDEAIAVCRHGLTRHPGYVSARLTLGRALVLAGRLDEAATELEGVLKAAPQNLAAFRALADIRSRQGDRRAALNYYNQALMLAPNDPELERAVAAIAPEVMRESRAEAEHAGRVVAGLERFLTAIHVSRA